MELFRFILAAFFFLSGTFILGVSTLGLFRLKSSLNRLHAAAKCDTLGALLVVLGLAIIIGFGFTMLKLLLLVVFFWVSNPVAVYMIGHAEVQVAPAIENECEVIEL